MAKHFQHHASLTDVAKHSGREFSRMKGLVDFFSGKAPNIADSNYLTATDIPMVTSYTC